MSVVLFAVTRQGAETAERISSLWLDATVVRSGQWLDSEEAQELKPAVQTAFQTADTLVFIMATGIAVRLIAPYIVSKDSDPAVLVLDDQGRFVIPLLSGHLGGANRQAQLLANHLEATAVITTATDNRGLLAVDLLAQELGASIDDLVRVKDATAALLEGKTLFLKPWRELNRQLPEGYRFWDLSHEPPKNRTIRLTPYKPRTLPSESVWLIPKCIVAGIGCRKATSADAVRSALESGLQSLGIDRRALKTVASIDLKAQEAGILEVCKVWNLPFVTYTAEELEAVSGQFKQSRFVRSTTGTGAVCEPSGYLASGKGTCLLERKVYEGVTLSLWEEQIRENR